MRAKKYLTTWFTILMAFSRLPLTLLHSRNQTLSYPNPCARTLAR